MFIFKMIIFLGFILIGVFHPSYGRVIDLDQLCKSCNGTLEVREGGIAHCIVTTEEDMDCAQRASAEAYKQGVTIIPELKTNEQIEISEQGNQNMQIEQKDIEGKPEDFPPPAEDDLDGLELLMAGPEETIFMESIPKEETITEIAPTQENQD